jgi:hypothetical protein
MEVYLDSMATLLRPQRTGWRGSPRPVRVGAKWFLGDASHARDPALLRAMGISAVLNMAPANVPDTGLPFYGDAFRYLGVDTDDDYRFDIVATFAQTFPFITAATDDDRSGAVLVHCLAGINRSGATVVGFTAWKQQWPLLRALLHVRRARGRRGQLLNNEMFQQRLVRWAAGLALLEAPAEAAALAAEVRAEELARWEASAGASSSSSSSEAEGDGPAVEADTTPTAQS